MGPRPTNVDENQRWGSGCGAGVHAHRSFQTSPFLPTGYGGSSTVRGGLPNQQSKSSSGQLTALPPAGINPRAG